MKIPSRRKGFALFALLVVSILLYPTSAFACFAYDNCDNGSQVYAYCNNGGCYGGCQCYSGGGTAGYTAFDFCTGQLDDVSVSC